MPESLTAIFVYGTLQRGEERAPCWPRAALSIQPATIRGELYDLGDYPALIAGNDIIGGELWTIAHQDSEVTLAALDEIECFGQGDVDLYVRGVIDCHPDQQPPVRAFTYFLADASLARQYPRVAASVDGICRWHRYR